MGEIVNLRTARKQRKRREKVAKAEVARLHHGRSKSEKTATKREISRQILKLDNHKLNRLDSEADATEFSPGKPDRVKDSDNQ